MKKYLTAVNFELTRRCNLNCEFCAKGTAQNKDITKDVIDKALDELSRFEVHTIRAGGGEPIKEVHKKYNTLTHTEAQELASLILASDCEKGDVDVRKFILENFYGDSTLTDEEIETGIQLLVLEHQSRICDRWDSLLNNTLLKNLIKFGV